jgi:hypothetical protein
MAPHGWQSPYALPKVVQSSACGASFCIASPYSPADTGSVRLRGPCAQFILQLGFEFCRACGSRDSSAAPRSPSYRGRAEAHFPKLPSPTPTSSRSAANRFSAAASQAEGLLPSFAVKLTKPQARSSSTPGLCGLDCARSSPRWPPTPARWLEPCACSPRQILSQPPVTVWRILRADEPPQQRGRWHLQRQPQHAGTPPKRPATTLSSP